MRTRLLSTTTLALSLSISAQLQTINEDFSTFSSTAFPQNGWTANRVSPYAYFIPNSNPQIYSLFDAVNPTYVFTPELQAIDGTQILKFDAQITPTSNAGGSVQVGTITDPKDLTGFTPISPVEALQPTATTYTYAVPATSAKYIAFKFQPSGFHAAMQFDNVVFQAGSLAVKENIAKNKLQFALVSGSYLQFTGTEKLEEISIYDLSGRMIQQGKVNNNQFSVNQLKSGIYIFTVTNSKGELQKAKFLKP